MAARPIRFPVDTRASGISVHRTAVADQAGGHARDNAVRRMWLGHDRARRDNRSLADVAADDDMRAEPDVVTDADDRQAARLHAHRYVGSREAVLPRAAVDGDI